MIADRAGNTYLLAGVISELDDAESLRMLAFCRRAMPADAQLLLVEELQPVSVAELAGRARERTEAQYVALLAVAGLTVTDIVPTCSGEHIIQARLAA